MDRVQIELLGRKHHVTAPDFAACEDLLVNWSSCSTRGGIPLMRVAAACIGLCTRLGREAGAKYDATTQYDLMGFGGVVYGHLRKERVSVADIMAAASAVLPVVTAAAAPRESEVQDALGNSEAGAES